MKTFQLFTTILLLAFTNTLSAQIEGDNVFANDQIVTIELNFSQVNFWDSLTLNYETSTYMKADLVLTDSTGTYSFDDVGVRLKGNSSYGHPGQKKSFKIDFNKYVSGQNYDGLKKLNVSNGFKDPSMLREKVFFDVCRAVGVPAPRANFANVYFNGELWGFYTLIEQIDDQFLDWKILDDDGNLFKAGANFGGGGAGGGNPADLKYYGNDQSSYTERYELKSNEDADDWSDLIELTSFIDNTTVQEFEDDVENHIELEDYLKTAALDNLFSNLDSYTGSARNYYIYHNLTTNKWEWIKWDGNESFGSYRAGGGGPGGPNIDLLTLDINYSDDDRPLLEKVFESDLLFDKYKTEMCKIRRDFFNNDFIDSKIDKFKTMIDASVLADDQKMYTYQQFQTNTDNDISTGGGPMGGTFYGLKSFVTARGLSIDSQLECPISSITSKTQKEKIQIYPNPFSTTIQLSWDSSTGRKVQVYDAIGVLQFEIDVNDEKTELDLGSLPKGVYFIKCNSTSGDTLVLSSKMVVKL